MDIELSALRLAEIDSIDDVLVDHDYRDNHDHFEVPRRRPVSTNAATVSRRRFPPG
jgi:hypothetical protein